MEENIENTDSPNSEINQEEILDTSTEESSEEVDTKVSKEEFEKLKKEKDELYIQLKKAKAARVQTTQAEVKETSESVSQKDLYALGQANVHIDDFDDVVEYAKFKKISIQEALKTDVIKTTLANKSEYRKTAEVSNTGASRRGAVKVSDDVLQKNLMDGKIPEKGSDEAERLFWARRGGKK